MNNESLLVHYLGHSSFLLRFGNGISVLTDYGESNAYGLESPIHLLGNVKPTIMTFSHRDADHFVQSKISADALTLFGPIETTVGEVEIRTFPVSERALDDNYAFVFRWKGLTVIHAGDVQGDMVSLADKDVLSRVTDRFSGPVDLLFFPIGWVRDILPDAAAFLKLLRPRRAIPMHYWCPGDKSAFLEMLAMENINGNTPYRFEKGITSEYLLPTGGTISAPAMEPTLVISFEPGEIKKTSESHGG